MLSVTEAQSTNYCYVTLVFCFISIVKLCLISTLHFQTTKLPPLLSPPTVPGLRCYLGPHQVVDYSGSPKSRPVQKWILKLVSIYLNCLFLQ